MCRLHGEVGNPIIYEEIVFPGEVLRTSVIIKLGLIQDAKLTILRLGYSREVMLIRGNIDRLIVYP
jgi:hypothetical protein